MVMGQGSNKSFPPGKYASFMEKSLVYFTRISLSLPVNAKRESSLDLHCENLARFLEVMYIKVWESS